MNGLLFIFRYIENVFPGEYGIPQRFYFPFQKSYWCKQPVEVRPCNIVPLPNFEEEPSGLEVGVAIDNLRKVFKVSLQLWVNLIMVYITFCYNLLFFVMQQSCQ